ncbi:G protein-coupled receptor gpr1, partial [Elasticomyces elasticus]
MFAAVYIYVNIKFKSFSALQDGPSVSSGTNSRRSLVYIDDNVAPDEIAPVQEKLKHASITRPNFAGLGSYRHEAEPQPPRDPWDEVSFITSKPLHDAKHGIETTDFAGNVTAEQIDPPEPASTTTKNSSRKPSEARSTGSSFTGETLQNPNNNMPVGAHEKNHLTASRPHKKPRDPLEVTRNVIRKQL